MPLVRGFMPEALCQVNIGLDQVGGGIELAVAVSHQLFFDVEFTLEDNCWDACNSLGLDILRVVVDREALVLWILEVKV